MRGTIVGVCIAFAFFAAAATSVAAQERKEVPEPSGPSLGVSVGFTADPGTFLLALSAPFSVADGVSVGPLLQLGLSDDDTIVAPTANVRYAFDLSGASSPDVRRLRPFIQGGLGFAYIEKDRRRGDDDDIGFLFNVGGGIEYFLTDHIAVGTNMMFNVLPDSVVGEHFFFSWQLGSVRFVF